MKISKITYVFNKWIYILISIVLIYFYLDSTNYLLLFIIVIFLIFIFINDSNLFILNLLFITIFLFKYYNDINIIYSTSFNDKINCTIYTIPIYKDDYYKFYCKANNGKILVYLKDVNKKNIIKIGYEIQINNNLQYIKNNTIPNQFNYAKYLLSKHIVYQSYNENVKVINTNTLINYKVINYIYDYYQNRKLKNYILSFILGNKYELNDEFNNDIKELNISHLFVVSGFHVGFLYIFFNKTFKYLKITNDTSNVLIIILLFIFLIINNFSTSVFRAFCFIFIYIIKNKYNLVIDNINILSFIAIINLFINPFNLYDTGFILSYFITFILFLSSSLFKNYHNIFYNLFKINIVAQLFSLPIIANYNFKYNFLSFITTPFLSLYYTFIIFPLTLIVLIFPNLENIFISFFTSYEIIISFLSKINILNQTIGYFSINRIIIYYILLVLIMRALEKRKVILFKLIILIIIILFYHKFSLIDEVTYLDVGQGDSIFIRSDINKCKALIDTGGNETYHPGENIYNYLMSTQIKTLDVLFISHTDNDHAGDYRIILDNFSVKNIVLSSYDESNLHDEIINYALKKKINIIETSAYNKVECGSLLFYILNPHEENNTNNDNSLVLFLIFNNETFLFTGDISQNIEKELSLRYEFTIDFLKVSHHGSKYSTSKNFLEKFEVKNAIISVGKNFYNHPSDEVLTLLENEKINYYRTDINGSVSVKYYLRKKRIILSYKPYNIDT